MAERRGGRTMLTAKERAERVAAAMWENDRASRWAGMELAHVDEGTATVEMTVAPHHCNGHGICHGGVIFLLADSAFAYACNSRNRSTLAQHNMISFIAPARAGDRLKAVAREVGLTGRNGIYDVTVTGRDGTVIAEFRGMSRAVRGHIFPET